jgi:transposase-like protein
VAGTTARAAAGLVGVQPNTAIRFFMRLRQLIASKLPSYELSGDVEADESYFGGKRNHINGIENFWNQAKRHMRVFNGIKQDNFYWFLKECEWRFNGGNHQQLLKQLKYWYKISNH